MGSVNDCSIPSRRITEKRPQFCQRQTDRSAHQRDQDRLGQNEHQHKTIRKPHRLQNGKLPDALAHSKRHRVSGHQQEREKHYAANRENQEFNIPGLFYPGRGHRLQSFALRLKRRVREHVVNCLYHPGSVIRRVELHRIPADLAFERSRAMLVEILVLNPELT